MNEQNHNEFPVKQNKPWINFDTFSCSTSQNWWTSTIFSDVKLERSTFSATECSHHNSKDYATINATAFLNGHKVNVGRVAWIMPLPKIRYNLQHGSTPLCEAFNNFVGLYVKKTSLLVNMIWTCKP